MEGEEEGPRSLPAIVWEVGGGTKEEKYELPPPSPTTFQKRATNRKKTFFSLSFGRWTHAASVLGGEYFEMDSLALPCE